MKNHSPKKAEYQVELTVDEEVAPQTEYAGSVLLKQLWDAFGVPEVLASADIRYDGQVTKASDMLFMLSIQPWVRSDSQRQVTQRFGGEPSVASLEADVLLGELLSQRYAQRTLNRFSNTARYDWQALNRARLTQLQAQPGFTPHRKGVLIVDDLPLPKPYAQEMDYLTSIWDNNVKHTVSGYAVVHLYYYHPKRPSYSLHLEPWLKTSATGETQSKRGARRRARPGEERSKLDIALDAVEMHWDSVAPLEAVAFDSWYTARWFCYELSQAEIPWVGEADTKQHFQVDGETLSVPEIYARYRGRMRQLKKFPKGVRAFAISAILKADAYTKESQVVQLVLLEGLTKERDNDKGYDVIVTNQVTWTPHHIVRVFSYRPKIEAVHREGKQYAGWNDFHTRRLPALQCHLAVSLFRSMLLMLLTCLPALREYSLAQLLEHVLACPALIHFASDQTKLYVVVSDAPPFVDFLTQRLKRGYDLLFTCQGSIPFEPGGV
jgi:hypothetical protein